MKIKPGERPRIMAVLNLTPDSFYGGSRVEGLDDALRRVEEFIEEGADFLDVGAESSRPGALPVDAREETDCLVPVVEAVSSRFTIPISVDTCKAVVAERVLDAGAALINDISGLRDSGMAETVARFDAGLIVMHMQGTPTDMQDDPQYDDLFGEILRFLGEAVEKARTAGIRPEKIAVDPGIGFGKLPEHNLALIAGLARFRELGQAVLLGASRKSFIGKVLDLPVDARLEGSLACALMGMLNGADIIRVHDVAPTLRALEMGRAIMNSGSDNA
ncbi:MAG: dihydropteroate synthase [Nitrospina sp.]|nr:dihydropteroate synthase [Nitrospina sp.]